MTLDTIRQKAGKFLIVLLWLHLPLIFLASFFTEIEHLTLELALAGALAAIASLWWNSAAHSPAGRLFIATAQVGMVAILVFTFRGHEWQIDLHMYFFASLGLVAALCDCARF